MGIFNPFNGTFSGPAVLANGSGGTPGLSFGSDSAGWYRNAANQWTWVSGGNNVLSLISSVFRLGGVPIVWTSTADSTQSADTGVSRTAAATLAIGNGNQADATGTVNCGKYQVAGTQVVSSRITGYGTPTGNANQGSFAAGSITLPNLAAGVAQLILDLKTHGLLGT